MKRSIALKETLVYYDGPEVFVGADQVNTSYLCLLVERALSSDRFLCIPISPQRLAAFCLGEIDLREIYEKPEVRETYYAEVAGQYETIELKEIPPDSFSEEWLPEPGFYFAKEAPRDEAISQQADSRFRAIVHISATPPEATEESKISTAHLVQLLHSFQAVLKHAFKKAMSDLGEEIRKVLAPPENYTMDVFAFSPGSFTVHLQSRCEADLWDHVHISYGLKKLDELTAHVGDRELSLRLAQENRGHFAAAYLRFLESIIRNDGPVSYTWTLPKQKEPVHRRITKRDAAPLCELLSSRRELTMETRDFVGRFLKADTTTGTWIIESDDDGKKHSGRLGESSEVTLDGVTIKTQTYRFECEERIEEIVGTGRERTILTLIRYEKL